MYRPRWEETDLPDAVYSVCKIIRELVKDGMDEEEALEFYDFNIVGAYMGEFTPIYIDDTGV